MTESTCYTYFLVSGEFDCKEFVRQLGLKPFDGWNAHELFPDRSENDWILKFCKCEEFDGFVYRQLEQTIAPLEEKIEILKQLKEKFGLYYALTAIPNVFYQTDGKYATVLPSLSPSLRVMKFCVEIGAELDIDYEVTT